MATRLTFPELNDDMPMPPDSSEDDGTFAPIYTDVKARLPNSGAEAWRPMHARGSQPSGGLPNAHSTAAGRAPEPIVPVRASIPDIPARPEPRVDPRELERIRAQARDEGYREGLARGDADGRNAWNKRIERVETLLLALGEARESLFHMIRQDLVKIVTLIPRKILRQAIQINPQAIASMVGSILEELPRQERVVVKVAPEDLRMLEEAQPELRRRLGGYTQVDLEPSAQVPAGGAIIVTEGGRVEATIDRQLETFEIRAREWILGASGPVVEAAELLAPSPSERIPLKS